MMASKSRDQFNVLVVDDEETLRELIAMEMELLGFRVYCADSAMTALEIIRKIPIDLVLSDVKMPNGDGVFLLESIRHLGEEAPIVILVTGYSGYTIKECIDKGAHKVIEKPFPRQFLIDQVLGALKLLEQSAS